MKDERRFKDVIHTIENAERDKDKFLKASRLSRNEKPRREIDDCVLVAVLIFVTIWLMMILVFIGGR